MQLVYNTEKYEKETTVKIKNSLMTPYFKVLLNDCHIPIANSNIYAVLSLQMSVM